ncbi:hypothetical protein STXM2123_4100 [Streptomyces sp. F-3]|nr:hypothetical protein STXM2123_4100 [Streptomyces sp. F-3]
MQSGWSSVRDMCPAGEGPVNRQGRSAPPTFLTGGDPTCLVLRGSSAL